MKHLLLLHGALGAQTQFDRLKLELQAAQAPFQVHSMNFEGHGGEVSTRPFSMELFSENVLTYLHEKAIEHCAIFGYSMGGYVALKLASQHPEKVTEIVTLGTKFAWSPEIAANETAMLNPEKIEEKVPTFASALALLHSPLDWKEMMRKTAQLMIHLGNERSLSEDDLRRIQLPVTLLLGSEDVMVTCEETEQVEKTLSNAQFMMVKGWQHPIERVHSGELAEKIIQLLG